MGLLDNPNRLEIVKENINNLNEMYRKRYSEGTNLNVSGPENIMCNILSEIVESLSEIDRENKRLKKEVFKQANQIAILNGDLSLDDEYTLPMSDEIIEKLGGNE